MARLPVRGLTGPPTVVGDFTPGARLEGNAVPAIGGEAVVALLGLGGGGVLVLLRAGHFLRVRRTDQNLLRSKRS